jgi:hypothetical protein
LRVVLRFHSEAPPEWYEISASVMGVALHGPYRRLSGNDVKSAQTTHLTIVSLKLGGAK